MALENPVQKLKQEIIIAWKSNKISWAQALSRLNEIGFSDEDAARILAKS